jgi:hypothetical protein
MCFDELFIRGAKRHELMRRRSRQLVSRRLEWMPTARPLFDETTGTWSVEESGWTHVEYSAFSSDDLLEQVDRVRPILDQ